MLNIFCKLFFTLILKDLLNEKLKIITQIKDKNSELSEENKILKEKEVKYIN